jgi:hypothetical protein
VFLCPEVKKLGCRFRRGTAFIRRAASYMGGLG